MTIRTAVMAIMACAGICAGHGAAAAEPDGRTLYFNHCASCHGPTGEGDGPVASALRGSVPNLRTLAMRNGGDFPAEAVAAYIDGRSLRAAHGDRLMPVWGDVFSAIEGGDAAAIAARVDLLVRFIAELQYR
jgi:mono/diheme cytochrome c family protein